MDKISEIGYPLHFPEMEPLSIEDLKRIMTENEDIFKKYLDVLPCWTNYLK